MIHGIFAKYRHWHSDEEMIQQVRSPLYGHKYHQISVQTKYLPLLINIDGHQRTHHTSVSNIFSLSLASIPSKYWSSYPNSPSVSRWAPAAGLRTNCKQVYFPVVSNVSICDREWGIRKPIIPMSSWTLSSVVSVWWGRVPIMGE